mgnify:CR=1 FL=1
MIIDAIRRWMGSGSNGKGDDGDGSGMLSCEETLARLYEFLDGELEDVTQAQVEAHFDVCAKCYPHLAMERSFLDALHRVVEGESAPSHLKSRVLQLLEELPAEE